MVNQCLLFVDLLGVKARWVSGGRQAAEAAFQEFWNAIAQALRGETPANVELGFLESDSAAIVCATPASALKIARRLYMAVFLKTENNEQVRPWLRGVVIPRKFSDPLRSPTKFKPSLHIDLLRYSGDLLDAITIEKCGFKGMRILVSDEVLTEDTRSDLKMTCGDIGFFPFQKLHHSGYPLPISIGFRDYLWMAEPLEQDKRRLDTIMALRLRHASRDAEESLQAAATQVLFHEVTAILNNLRAKDRRSKAKVTQ